MWRPVSRFACCSVCGTYYDWNTCDDWLSHLADGCVSHCFVITDTPTKGPEAEAGSSPGHAPSQDLVQPAAASPGTYAATATPFQGGSHSLLGPTPSSTGAPSAGSGSLPHHAMPSTGNDTTAAPQAADDSQLQVALASRPLRTSVCMVCIRRCDVLNASKRTWRAELDIELHSKLLHPGHGSGLPVLLSNTKIKS